MVILRLFTCLLVSLILLLPIGELLESITTINRCSFFLVHLFEQEKLLSDQEKYQLISRYKLHEKLPLARLIQLTNLEFVVNISCLILFISVYHRKNTTVCFHVTSQSLKPNSLIQVSCQKDQQHANGNLPLRRATRYKYRAATKNITGKCLNFTYRSFHCFPTISFLRYRC